MEITLCITALLLIGIISFLGVARKDWEDKTIPVTYIKTCGRCDSYDYESERGKGTVTECICLEGVPVSGDQFTVRELKENWK